MDAHRLQHNRTHTSTTLFSVHFNTRTLTCTQNRIFFCLFFLSAEPESEERDIKHAVSFFDRAQRAFQQELANVAAAASGANAENHSSAVLDILSR